MKFDTMEKVAPSQIPVENYPEEIARLITEDPDVMSIRCPTCGAHGAYIGFNTVECPNPNCRHYSKKQAFEHQREVMRQESEYRLTPPNIVKALEDNGFEFFEYLPSEPSVGIMGDAEVWHNDRKDVTIEIFDNGEWEMDRSGVGSKGKIGILERTIADL